MTKFGAGTEVDVVVVGAGTAGCIVARRLVDAGASVLLIEAGGESADHEAIADPRRMHQLWDSPADWALRTVPQEHAHGRVLHLPRGRVVGGSHALNAMIWVRGNPADYDTWAYLGNADWSWADVEPVFERLELQQDIVTHYEPDLVHRGIVDAAVQAGVPFNDNYNGKSQDGVSFTQLTIRHGRRVMTADAFLAPVRGNALLQVLPNTTARRLLLENGRCTGVEIETGGQIQRIRARHEVVLCAGAIGSPVILQRSGIGAPDELRRLGVEVSVGLPGVGRNLQDHWLVPVILSTTRSIRSSPGLPPTQSHLFWRSRPELVVPDLQPIHFAAPLLTDWMVGPTEGISLMAGLVRPASRGTVAIASTDPETAPLIDPQVLSAPEDMTALIAAVELCRTIAQQPALSERWGAQEIYPGTLGSSDELLRDYIRETVVTYHHQSGTCAMGSNPDSVVDGQLAVHGVVGLSVADASIMPTITTGNTNAPVAMIGERAAAFTLRRMSPVDAKR